MKKRIIKIFGRKIFEIVECETEQEYQQASSKKPYGEPFVVSTDEVDVEIRKKKKKKERINLEEIL